MGKQTDYEEFYGIKCRRIHTSGEYFILKKQVSELYPYINKIELRIEAENRKINSQDGVNKNSGIYYPIVISWIYAIVGFASGSLYSDSDGLGWLLFVSLVILILCTCIAGKLVDRSKNIYERYRTEEIFYETICKIIDE